MKAALTLLMTALASIAANTASAQPVTSSRPSEIARVNGEVYLDDRRINPQARELPKMTENSLMRTGDGRAEVRLARGVTLRLGANGSFRMTAHRPGNTRIEMLAGTAVVITDEENRDANLTAFCENEVTLSGPGEYRFDYRQSKNINENFCLFKVYRGAAEVRLSTLNVRLREGHMMDLNRHCGDHIPINRFDTNEPQRNRGFQ